MDYMIAPKASFDATADAIRALNGTSTDITWGQDGFASAIGNERKYGYSDIVQGGRFTDASVTLGEDVIRLKPHAFTYDTALQSINAPYVVNFNAVLGSSEGGYIFDHCSNLTNVYLPSLRSVGSGGYQFSYCTSLQNINLPFSNIGQYMFSNCSNLETAVIGYLRQGAARMNSCAFLNDTKLTTVDLDGVTSIYSAEFSGCSKLNTLILRRKDAITALGNINCFNNTPFKSGGTGGTIYIPKIYYDQLGEGGSSDYQSATNWSTIYGYGTITWACIEGSYYETHYGDGTEVAIGDGVNLLINSEHFDPTKEPYTHSNTLIDSGVIDTESYYRCSGQYYIQIDLPLLTVGTTYVLSFELYRSNAQDVYWTENGYSPTLAKNTGNAWTRYSIPIIGFTPQKTRSVRIQINNTSATGTSTYIAAFRHFKLEKGTTNTAWTLTPSEQGGAS